MQKIIKWFAPIITIGVAIFIVFFLISINSSPKTKELEPLVYENKVTNKKQQNIWLNHFSKTKKKGYFYPVNEVYVSIDLKEKAKEVKRYKLLSVFKDPYELFCLKEELKRHKLKYYLFKQKNGVDLIIYSKDIKKLNSLVNVLKNYQISAKIKLVKEDEK